MMTRHVPFVLAAMLSMGTACASDEETEPMQDRVTQLGDAVDVLVAQLVDHYADVLEIDRFDRLEAVEALHFQHTIAALAGIELWVTPLAQCTDDAGDAPDVADLQEALLDAERQAAMHVIIMKMVDDLEAARRAEYVYQMAMMAEAGNLRATHLYMEDIAVQYACPPIDLALVPGGYDTRIDGR